MSCALTQGYTLACADGIGGIKEVRLVEWTYIDTGNGATVTSASGQITAITLASSKKFWKYEMPPANADMIKETWQKNNAAGTLFWEQELQLSIRKLQATLRNEIRLIAQNRLAAIVLDRNGTYWLLGEKSGLELEPSDGLSGANRGDFNGYILKFKGSEPAPMQEVSSSIIAGITN